ncbi:MAG: murein biosynthesis integral membrane protein MurJ [Firmicutes bacterium]|nr:murein biosynthesis integral membrane protein MurJ [Bacillota bacterium]
MKKSSLFKATTLLMIVTMISKFVGFGREVAIANFFGATIYTDAYLIALAVPTVLFGPVMKAINFVFIPIFDKFRREGRDKPLALRFTGYGFLVTTLLFIVPVLLFPADVVRLFAPGFDEYAVGVGATMVQILIVLIVFRFLSAVFTAILHVDRNFVVPGLTGFPYSLIIIGFSFLLHRQLGIYALIWGTFFGTLAQWLMLIPWTAKSRFQGALTDKCADGLRHIGLLLPPVILGSMAQQVKAMIDRMFASGLAEGSISYLSYASMIYLLPLSLFVTVVITVAYPSMVEYANEGDMASFKDTLNKSLGSMWFLLMPVVVGFIVFTGPMVTLIYERGEFDALATAETAFALRFYGIGLIGAALHQLMIKCFYSLKDTRTPLYATFIMIAVNIGINFALIGPLRHGGLAFGTALAALTGGGYLFVILSRRIGRLVEAGFWLNMAKSVVAAVVMGLCLLVVSTFVGEIGHLSFIWQALLVGSVLVASAGVYFLVAWVLKVDALTEVVAMGREYLERRRSKKIA